MRNTRRCGERSIKRSSVLIGCVPLDSHIHNWLVVSSEKVQMEISLKV